MGSIFSRKYWFYTRYYENLFNLSKDEFEWFKLIVNEAMKG